MPPLEPQDLSRSAVCELLPLSGTTAPPVPPEKMRALGASLRRRLIDHWPRLAGTLETFRAALIEAGHRNRGADQYGTLLACAELVLHDRAHVPAAELTKWKRLLDARILAAEATICSTRTDACGTC